MANLEGQAVIGYEIGKTLKPKP